MRRPSNAGPRSSKQEDLAQYFRGEFAYWRQRGLVGPQREMQFAVVRFELFELELQVLYLIVNGGDGVLDFVNCVLDSNLFVGRRYEGRMRKRRR